MYADLEPSLAGRATLPPLSWIHSTTPNEQSCWRCGTPISFVQSNLGWVSADGRGAHNFDARGELFTACGGRARCK
jgi:hypothetical protein